MSEFEHLYHMIHLQGRPSIHNDERFDMVVEHSFALLNAWMGRASGQDKHEAWEFTQINPNPYLSAWWFTQELTDPQIWPNTWKTDDFKQHVLTDRVHIGAYKHVVARIDWAMQHNDWGFFDNWDSEFVRRAVSRLCRQEVNNSTVANVLVGLKRRNPDVFISLYNQIPVQYIQQHADIIPGGHSLLAQNRLVQSLKTRDLTQVVDVLNKYRNDLNQGEANSQLILELSSFWEHSNPQTLDQQNEIIGVAQSLREIFPKNVHQITPTLSEKQCARWQIEANIWRPEYLQNFARNKTSNMLGSLLVFPNINSWVDFWTDTISVKGWTPEMTSAGDGLYIIGASDISKVKLDLIETQLAPHWDFFEHSAPRMGRALAAVVVFLGGNAPEHLCDFSNLFDFDLTERVFYPKEFKNFVESHIQHQSISQQIDPANNPKHSRKI